MDYTMLVNRDHPLPEGFQPDNLVDLFSLDNRRFLMDPKRMLLEASAAFALNRMCADAEKEENLTDYYVFSAWRSHEEQENIYRCRRQDGYVALPGCSEHETGLAIDIDSAGPDRDKLYFDWLQKNSWKYGFILRYPAGKERITRIEFEPWHFRYVGEELAAILYENKWTMEEYYNRSIPPRDPYDPEYIFVDIFGSKMKGHWQVWPDIDLEDLRRVNPATVGWVHMEATPIDYPVVGPSLSNNWCLTHNFSGEPSAHGMVRLSYGADERDLVLSAHNMLDTTMFMKMDEIRKSGSFKDYPSLELNINGVRYLARWFSANLVEFGTSPSMPPSGDPVERAKWLAEIRERAEFVSDTVPEPTDRILACLTCAEHAGNPTTALYAVISDKT